MACIRSSPRAALFSSACVPRHTCSASSRSRYTTISNFLKSESHSLSRSSVSRTKTINQKSCAHNASSTKRSQPYSTQATSSEPPHLIEHNRDVETIRSTIRDHHSRNQQYRIFHGSTNSTRAPDGSQKYVDISALNRVLHVDFEKRVALVEPNVSMDRLVEATLPHGLVPPVVMEFPAITAGGGFAGTCGESSSFKHGFFNRTIESAEMVLANGEVVRVSEQENKDLFDGAAGALGTFGVTTLVELHLEEAKKYVETKYHPVIVEKGSGKTVYGQTIEMLKDFAKRDDIDYLDGILFSPEHAAIVTGRMTNEVPTDAKALQRFSAPSDPWYYMHVESTTSKSPSQPVTETIPLAEYLLRYDRGGFWVGRAAFDYMRFPFNSFTRWWLDDFLHTRMLYTALHASQHASRFIVQDFGLPWSTSADFLEYSAQKHNIWPIWLCPLLKSPGPNFHPRSRLPQDDDESHILNVGLYGWGPQDPAAFVEANRDINATLYRLGGTKWLYAQTYYTEDEFWNVYDRKWYDELRSKYNATGLPSVSDKVKWGGTVKEQAKGWQHTWPFPGFKGIREAIKSRTYVQARKAAWRNWS